MDTMTKDTTARDQMLHDVFVTALEGGIGYWSTCSEYVWRKRDPQTGRPMEGSVDETADLVGFHAVIEDTEDDNTEYRIDRAVIARGLRRAWEDRKGHSDYHSVAINALHFGKYDDADYDADTADIIVQWGLLNEHRYG